MICFCGFDTAFVIMKDIEHRDLIAMSSHLANHHPKLNECPCGQMISVSGKRHFLPAPSRDDWLQHLISLQEEAEVHLMFHQIGIEQAKANRRDLDESEDEWCVCGHERAYHYENWCEAVDQCSCTGFVSIV